MTVLETISQSRPLVLPELAAYRKKVGYRQATAFCDAPEYVAGIEVLPLTPRTWSMLYAVGSPFAHGGPISADAILTYLWFHSPSYAHAGVQGWQIRKREALRPFLLRLTQPWRKWLLLKPVPHRARAAISMAGEEIKALLNEAFADADSGNGRPGKPVATLEAFMIHNFALRYQWTPERTRNVPLRQLFQLLRCMLNSVGAEVRDSGEDEILFAHMRRRMDALNQARAIEEAKPEGAS